MSPPPVATAILLLTGTAAAQVSTHLDLEYARIGTRSLKLDLYLPSAADPAPCVVWFHWGGWRDGAKHVAKPDAMDLAARGIAVASIEYRLSAEAKWPSQIHDAKGAVRWLRAHATRYRLDPDRFAAFGHSSGGHLAAMLGTTGGVASIEGTVGGNLEQSSRVQFAVDFAGPTDFFGPAVYEPADSFVSELIGKPIGEIKKNRHRPEYAPWVALVESANPANYVTSDDARFLIAHGTQDTLVPPSQAQLLHDALRQAGLQSELKLVTSPHNLPGYTWNERRTLLLQWFGDVPFRPYGKGCNAPGANEPACGSDAPPVRGQTFGLTLSQGPASNTAVAMLCAKRALVPLDMLGMPGCSVLVLEPVLQHFAATDRDGEAAMRLFLPASLPAGIVIRAQWVAHQPGANQAGFIMSNAARIVIQ